VSWRDTLAVEATVNQIYAYMGPTSVWVIEIRINGHDGVGSSPVAFLFLARGGSSYFGLESWLFGMGVFTGLLNPSCSPLPTEYRDCFLPDRIQETLVKRVFAITRFRGKNSREKIVQ
jgi:hypothetical protein